MRGRRDAIAGIPRTLNTQSESGVLDGGDGGLRNGRRFGQSVLAPFLEFPQDTVADGMGHCPVPFRNSMASS